MAELPRVVTPEEYEDILLRVRLILNDHFDMPQDQAEELIEFLREDGIKFQEVDG